MLQAYDKVQLSSVDKFPRIPSGFLQKLHDVSQLDKAEAMAQDAFKKANAPGATYADKQWADEEMKQAEQIRKQVEKDFTPGQVNTLEHIKTEEKNAVHTAETAGDTWIGGLARSIASKNMADGANESKTLDNWIFF